MATIYVHFKLFVCHFVVLKYYKAGCHPVTVISMKLLKNINKSDNDVFTGMLLWHLPPSLTVLQTCRTLHTAAPQPSEEQQCVQQKLLRTGLKKTTESLRCFAASQLHRYPSDGIQWHLWEASSIHKDPTLQPTVTKGAIAVPQNTRRDPEMFPVYRLTSQSSFGGMKRTYSILSSFNVTSWLIGLCSVCVCCWRNKINWFCLDYCL